MNLLVLGDSVVWGQGLLPAHKFSTIVAAALGAANPEIYAHSGAIIGIQNTQQARPVDGEVPVSLPSIVQQLSCCTDPAAIDLVIVNGGINDVSVAKILSPWTTKVQLDQSVHAHCGLDMIGLLQKIGVVVRKAGAKVIVPGYYVILSTDSTHFFSSAQLYMLLEMHGVATGSFALGTQLDPDLLLNTVTRNCEEFYTRSNAELSAAVTAANQQFKGSPQFIFVPLPFTDQNAVFASNPLLWGLTVTLEAEDEVVAARVPECDVVFGDVLSLPKRFTCHRASAGHPNVEGAATIARAILAAL